MITMEWDDKITVKKANVGEKIIDDLIRANGRSISYAPITDGGHPFDRLIASKDKKHIQIAEVKALDKRRYYDDTGISIKHYKGYKHISDKYGMKVFIFFVDGSLSEIYGNFLDKLEVEYIDEKKNKKYPLIESNKKAIGREIIYFPMANMKRNLYRLSGSQVEELKELTEYYGLTT